MVGLETPPALRGAVGVANCPAKFWSPVWDSPWRNVPPVWRACVVRQSKSLGSPAEVVRRCPKTRRGGHVSEAWSRGMSCDLGPPFRELVWLWPR